MSFRANDLVNGVFIHALTKKQSLSGLEPAYSGEIHTSQGNFLLGRCHWSISQNTMAQEKTSTLWLYLGCACQSSGACQLTVPTRLRTIDRVDCFTLASPKSAILAVPRMVMRIFDDLQSRWMTDGLRRWRYSKPRAISSIMANWTEDGYILAQLALSYEVGKKRRTTLCSDGAGTLRT